MLHTIWGVILFIGVLLLINDWENARKAKAQQDDEDSARLKKLEQQLDQHNRDLVSRLDGQAAARKRLKDWNRTVEEFNDR